MSSLLSEHIRLGAMISEQIFGRLWIGDDKSCAMGSAIFSRYGVGCRTWSAEQWQEDGGILKKEWPYVYDNKTHKCELCGGSSADISMLVVHLNDSHRLSRQEIADIVEQYERSIGLIAEPLMAETVELVAV